MSNTIQYKLLQLEVSPPPQVWQLLEQELEAARGDHALKASLENLEINAPATNWNTIAAALEPVPEMDLTAKLREASVNPPPSAWQEIEKRLSQPAPAKRKWIRYAAAAAIAGLLFSSAYFLSFSSNEKLALAPAATKENKVPAPLRSDDAVTTQEQHDEEALEQSKHTYASVNVEHKKISRIASGYRFASEEEIPENDRAPQEDINDRYIVLMTPEGNFIRVSKKLGNLVCCVSGEEEDPACKEQVGKWQRQIAAADLSHSGDFGDILKLVSELQQDK